MNSSARSSRILTPVLVLVLGAAAVLAAAGPAVSAPPGPLAWTASGQLAELGGVSGAGIGRAGTAEVFFGSSSGAEDDPGQRLLATRPAGGAWIPPVAGGVAQGTSGVAVGTSGAQIAWTADDAGLQLQWRASPAVAWPAPVPLAAGRPRGVEAAVNDIGQAAIAWIGPEGVMASRMSSDGRWAAVRRLSADRPREGSHVSLALSDRGDVVVAWRGTSGGVRAVRAATARAGSAWAATRTVTRSRRLLGDPDVAVSLTGRATVVMLAGPDASDLRGRQVWSSDHPATAAHWTTPRPVVRPSTILGMQIGVDAAGSAMVAIGREVGQPLRIVTRRAPAPGRARAAAWRAPAAIGDFSVLEGFTVSTMGTALLATQDAAGPAVVPDGRPLRLLRRAPSGGWEADAGISPGFAADLALAVSPAGAAVAAWAGEGSNTRSPVAAAAVDAPVAPPAITSLVAAGPAGAGRFAIDLPSASRTLFTLHLPGAQPVWAAFLADLPAGRSVVQVPARVTARLRDGAWVLTADTGGEKEAGAVRTIRITLT